MKEEMKKILQMVKEKKITVEEAEKLIDALGDDTNLDTYEESGELEVSDPKQADMKGRFLRVRVTEDGQQKVQVNVPLQLVEVGLKIGMQVGPQFSSELQGLKNIDFNEIIEAIRQGASGKLVEVNDGSDLVEIYLD